MTSSLRQFLKRCVPAPIKKMRQQARFNRTQAENRDRPLEAVFNDIYESSAWAKPDDAAKYSSGPGSSADVTRGYEDYVIAYLEKTPTAKTIVDIGCGDFQVANRILNRLSRPVTYIGCDVASKVVAYNQATHARPGVEFRHIDASIGPLPAGDIVLVREVFQHLSTSTIQAAIGNMRRAYPFAIITEAVWNNPKVTNVDLVSGFHSRDVMESGNYLELPPFNLTILDEYRLNRTEEEDLRTLLIDLRAR
jgi:SAM-dependent methyltransferase